MFHSGVLSDFWPHGALAAKFGALLSDGVSERALFIIAKQAPSVTLTFIMSINNYFWKTSSGNWKSLSEQFL